MPISRFNGVAINHVALEVGESAIVSRARAQGYDVTFSVVRVRKKDASVEMEALIHRHQDNQSVTVSLDPREVKVLHEQTVRRKVVGLMVPHMAETLALWVRDELYNPFADSQLTEKKSA
ncbi:hypothetical protein [Halomonas sp. LBP4]|uniref:hypothetical protein n=1 Tax=Halomonas sp. LBP4 TaxID=2044917 RepID=UPI000D75C5DA|nr:hypothetical protein [Halomonas sp. LBP4]PXX94684.1 hypothetical protein CR157_21510 [Halomonas sp. LBP4]